jgi:hypothetical protein
MSNDDRKDEPKGEPQGEPPGNPTTMKNKTLMMGAAATQVSIKRVKQSEHPRLTRRKDLGPIKSVCAHLNAFHAYADNPTSCVETNHYCAHLSMCLSIPDILSSDKIGHVDQTPKMTTYANAYCTTLQNPTPSLLALST